MFVIFRSRSGSFVRPRAAALVVSAFASLLAVSPRALAKTDSVQVESEQKKNCDRHFPGLIQGEIRNACSSATEGLSKYGKLGAEVRCRLDYGEEPREVMACLIGVDIAEDLAAKKDEFKKKLQLCAEQYPMHVEIDAFLQEACLTGVHLPNLLGEKPRLGLCAQITPERSFQGPCGVGLSLSQNDAESVEPSKQNKLCEQYFDHRKFHSGYRACLNARALALNWTGKVADIIKTCSESVAESDSDTTRAACMVGASVYQQLLTNKDSSARFQKCGENKVSYQERDFLACLTAASLLDFTDKNGAEAGCKDVFRTAKGRGRGDCLNSLSLF
jgi:hypothetical protein